MKVEVLLDGVLNVLELHEVKLVEIDTDKAVLELSRHPKGGWRLIISRAMLEHFERREIGAG